jgi:hypothetical protein
LFDAGISEFSGLQDFDFIQDRDYRSTLLSEPLYKKIHIFQNTSRGFM